MAHIEFLDETMRDGQQSLWGMRMQAGMALPVAPLIDRSGFRVIDLAGSSLFEVMIRTCRENPWEGLDLLVAAMPRTRIRGGMRSNASVTFGVTPDSLMDAWMRQLNRHGCRSFWIYDVLFNIDKMHRLAKVAKEFGSEVAGSIMFALSPVHTDAYYADKADKLSASPDIDTLLLYDTAGVLDKERLTDARACDQGESRAASRSSFTPTTFSASRPRPISTRSTSGSRSSTPRADRWRTVRRCPRPRSCCTTSSCSATRIRSTSHCCRRSPSISRRSARPPDFLVNQANEYDVLSIRHQIPGGMTGTLKAQLAQHNMTDKLDDVLRETAEVRRDLGYPGMATPFSQLVGIQAVLNIVTGKRYSIIPDEVIQYAAGFYGETVAPIDPNVRDMIMAAPRAKQVAGNPPEQPTIEELRKRYGTDDDDELILRALVPEPDLKKMREAGPVKRDFPLLSSPELDQVQRLMRIAKSPVVQIRSETLSLDLRRDAG